MSGHRIRHCPKAIVVQTNKISINDKYTFSYIESSEPLLCNKYQLIFNKCKKNILMFVKVTVQV